MQTIKNLYVENERVVLEGRWEEGFVAIVAVGATNVSSVRVLMMGIFVIELLIIEALQVLMLLSFSATIVFISVRNRKRGNDFCGVHSLAHYVSQCRLIFNRSCRITILDVATTETRLWSCPQVNIHRRKTTGRYRSSYVQLVVACRAYVLLKL